VVVDLDLQQAAALRHADREAAADRAWPRAGLPLAADVHLHGINNSCDRMCL
jgi:hypothetical protein